MVSPGIPEALTRIFLSHGIFSANKGSHANPFMLSFLPRILNRRVVRFLSRSIIGRIDPSAFLLPIAL